jgi:streptogramin lyase
MRPAVRMNEIAQSDRGRWMPWPVSTCVSGPVIGVRVARRVACWAPLAGLLVCVVLAALGWSSLASAETPAIGTTGQGSPLAFPGLPSPLDGQEAITDFEARRDSSVAVVAREKSRTSFSRLTGSEAAALAANTFPTVVDDPAAGAPRLRNGQRITRYLTNYAALVELGPGKHAAIESLEPMAVDAPHGRHVALDMGLHDAGRSFQLDTPGLGVSIPMSIRAGVALPRSQVSVTPIDSVGVPLRGSSGSIDGSSVLYPDTQLDSDSLIKPMLDGFAVETVLRSAASPRDLFFRIGMPHGARLTGVPHSGDVHVIDHGSVLATVLAPSAEDAAGTPAPVTMTVSGSRLELHIGEISGGYQYPVEVDPTVTDPQLQTEGTKATNWQFYSPAFKGKEHVGGSGEKITETYAQDASYPESAIGYWAYQTQGNSDIYQVTVATWASNTSAHLLSTLELQHGEYLELEHNEKAVTENKAILSSEAEGTTNYSDKVSELCAQPGQNKCLPFTGGENNAVRFQQSATKSCTACSFSDSIRAAVVYISQPGHAESSYNTTTPTVSGVIEGKKLTRANALYGSGGWLSNFEGGIGLVAADKGIGVSAVELEYERSPGSWEPILHHSYLEPPEAKCKGIQCYAKHEELWTLNPRLPNGEDKIRYRAEDAMPETKSAETEGETTIKVDTAKPHSISLSGLPYGNELTQREYKLTVTAADGEESIPSSGVKSIELYVDKGVLKPEAGGGTGECSKPKGECFASEKWAINGSQLGAGHHAIVMVVKDRAGNEERKEVQLAIRHSTPVAMGPGSVDLQSGDFSLNTSDVSMGDGLTVSRNFSSRDLVAGDEGPLGPQWSMSLATAQSLVELADGSVLVTAANGSQTIFAATKESTKFESPPGDSNLTLTAEENEGKTAKIAYYLEDAAAKTKVKFTQPSPNAPWVATEQQGQAGTDTVTYSYKTEEAQNEYPLLTGSEATSIARGSDGNLWFAEEAASQIGRITTSGTVTYYSLPLGSKPDSITGGPEGAMWFAEEGRERIGKITSTGVITEYLLPSKRDGGRNIPSKPHKITEGSEGLLWYTEDEMEFNFGGGFINSMTSQGAVTEHSIHSGDPQGITVGAEGDLWATINGPGLTPGVERLTPAGEATEYSVNHAGTSVGEIVTGAEGALWYTAKTSAGGYQVDKVTKAGVLTEYPMPSSSNPAGIAVGPDGNIWVTEHGADRLAKITASGIISEYNNALIDAGEPGPITSGPDGELWYGGPATIAKIPTAGISAFPTQALAPIPPGVPSCAWTKKPTEMHVGCRALEFEYSTETTAKGEAENEWGQYNRRLYKIELVEYNPATKEMQQVPVAEYAWDRLGRLRSEWDPRLATPLPTDYGYSQEGEVTSLDPPGEEPWSFSYGTTSNDAGSGRLTKVDRAQPMAGVSEAAEAKKIKEQKEPEAATEQPQITGTTYAGARLAVSNGKWSGNPITYSYQWDDCNLEGSNCSVIPGATNANYTPVNTDVGHSVVAIVTAINGWGAVEARSTASKEVKVGEVAEYSLAPATAPAGVAPGSDGNLWVADGKASAMSKVTPTGTVTKYPVGSGSACPSEVTFGPGGEAAVWATDFCRESIDKMTTSGVASEHYTGVSLYGGITSGPGGDIWFTNVAGLKVGKMTPAGVVASEYSLPGLGVPDRIAAGPDGNLWITGEGSDKIYRMTPSGEFTEYVLPGEAPADYITPGPGKEAALWFTVPTAGRIGRIATGGAITEYSLPAGSEPTSIVAGAEGALWFVDATQSRIGRITTIGTISEQALPLGSDPYTITAGPAGEDAAWFTDEKTGMIAKASYSPKEAEAKPPVAGETIEYNVPLEGSSAPAQMGRNPTTHEPEPAKWGQTQANDPVEATAIFPQDEPQGWPASGYKRATTRYLDEGGEQVNVETPSNSAYGAVSTTEYNEWNDVIRTLTPDNRATALAAGSARSVEVSKQLDTENTYNGEGAKESEAPEPGTELVESLGPQHEIRYVAGHQQKEALGRNYEKLFYNEGLPATEPCHSEKHDLVTKTNDMVQLANNEERLESRITTTSYSGQGCLGWNEREPTSVTTDPQNGETEPQLNLTRTTLYNEQGQVTETHGAAAERTLTFASKFGEYGTEPGKLKAPWGLAVSSAGDIWITTAGNNRIEEYGPEGKYLGKIGETGSEPGKLSNPQGIAFDSKGDLWVADSGNNRIEEFNPIEGKYLGKIGEAGKAKGQLKEPSAITFDSNGNLWVADTGNSRIQRFNVTEGKATLEFGSAGTGAGQLEEPKGIALNTEGGEARVWVADTGNNRLQEFSTAGTPQRHFGTLGAGEGQLDSPQGIAFDASGDLWVADKLNGRAEAFSAASGAYETQVGWKGTGSGQLSGPHSVGLDAHSNLWLTDGDGDHIDEWSPGPNAHDAKTIYYSAGANTEGYKECGEHPAWAGLVCQTRPVKQPELGGLPALPVTTVKAYNMWLEPETTEEAYGPTTRTKKESYDEIGRLTGSETTATNTSDTNVPKVSLEYNKETGTLLKESTSLGSVKTEDNRLGQILKYTDANGNTATYKYYGIEQDDLPEELSDSHKETKEGKEADSYQRYSYDETTKAMTKLIDSAAGTFTASYDAELNMTSQVFPNGMCANYTRNSVGETIGEQYLKTTNCAEPEAPVLYSDTQVPAIRGETLSQTSTLASETYSYDNAGRLTEGQETPAGGSCTARLYAYDEESNRSSLTTHSACSQTEGGTIEGHNYDEASRLTDSGIHYESLGNIEVLPSSDAEGHELKTTYYLDNAVATQSQNGVTHEYSLDPNGRDNEITTGTTKATNHYDGPGEGIAWTSAEEKTSKTITTTRNIPGIDGSLTAVQTNSTTPVLQLHDLQGDTVATIGDSTSETKISNTYNSTEFGVPNAGKAPPKYAWLGAGDVTSELASGVITEGATSYVPQTGRALQSEAVEPPGAPDGTGGGAPVSFEESPWVKTGAVQAGDEAPGIEAGLELEALRAAMASAADPDLHYYAWEAKKTGKALVELSQLGELGQGLTDLFGFSAATAIEDFAKSAVVKAAGLSVATELSWIEYFGLGLEGCASELHAIHDSHGGCRAQYWDFVWEGDPLPEFFRNPRISWCQGMDPNRGEVHWCTLLGDEEEVEQANKKLV